MTGPAIRALKGSPQEGRRITLLTSPAGAAITRLMAEVDDTIVHRASWMKASGDAADAAADRELIEHLRQRRFDAAVIFCVYSQSPLPAALVCFLAEVPLRLAHCRENPYALLTDWVREVEPEQLVRHEVRRQLDLVASVGASTSDERLRVSVPAGARAHARRTLDAVGLSDHRGWVVVHPGASAPSRRYPPELLAAVCEILIAAHGINVLLTGDPSEVELVEQVRGSLPHPSRARAHSVAGQLSLSELAAVLELAPVLVSGNSGPVHLAAAVGTPVVDVYALTNPQHKPWMVPSVVLCNDVPCRWCYRSICPEGHHLCLRGVAPAQVAQAALGLLESRRLSASRAG